MFGAWAKVQDMDEVTWVSLGDNVEFRIGEMTDHELSVTVPKNVMRSFLLAGHEAYLRCVEGHNDDVLFVLPAEQVAS